MRGLGILAAMAVLAAAPARAHSGGTDASGCHVDSSTGTRHCHGSAPGPGPSTGGRATLVDPAVLYGIGYATTTIGTIVLLGFVGCGEECGSGVYLWAGLLYAASEALAIGGFAVESGRDGLHLGLLTGFNVAGAIGSIVAAIVFGPRPPADLARPQLTLGPGTLSLSGVF